MLTPNHGNLGDHLIAKAEYAFFRQYLPQFEICEITGYEWPNAKWYLKKLLKPDDLIVINGGGSMGDLWPDAEYTIRDIIHTFPKNQVFIFPQTCYFTRNSARRFLMERSRAFYERYPNVRFFARDRASLELFQNEIAPNPSQCKLFPDMAVFLNESLPDSERLNILLCMRKDCEKVLSDEKLDELSALLAQSQFPVFHTDTVLEKSISPKERELELEKKLHGFRQARLVITDRLHGMLFAAITGTPCIAVNNVSKKVEGVYSWISYLDYVACVEPEEIDAELIRRMLRMGGQRYDNRPLLPYFEEMAQDILTIPQHAAERILPDGI